MRKHTMHVLSGSVNDKDIVFTFFYTFSRFEYALKRASFLKKDKAEADWTSYGKSISGLFATIQDEEFIRMRQFLLTEPPKRQVLVNGQLNWKDTPPNNETEETYILRLVSTVRNNLFHGGKYPYPVVPDSGVERNRKLLEACLVILENCLSLNQQVEHFFEEAA